MSSRVLESFERFAYRRKNYTRFTNGKTLVILCLAEINYLILYPNKSQMNGRQIHKVFFLFFFNLKICTIGNNKRFSNSLSISTVPWTERKRKEKKTMKANKSLFELHSIKIANKLTASCEENSKNKKQEFTLQYTLVASDRLWFRKKKHLQCTRYNNFTGFIRNELTFYWILKFYTNVAPRKIAHINDFL